MAVLLGSPNVAVSNSFNPLEGWPIQQKIGDYITVVSDNTGGDVAYSATYNFNPSRGQHEQDVYFVRVSPAGGPTPTPTATPTPTLRLRQQPQQLLRQRYSYGYANSHRNHYAERYSYRYTKADAHAAIRADAQAASHTGAETLSPR